MKPIRCILKKGKENPLLGRHPWVFSGAIDQIDDDFKAGDIVKVFSSQDQFLGMGYLNPRSQIAIRMLSFDDISINPGFFNKKIDEALALRSEFVNSETNAYRVIHSEGDGLPGLIVDRYADYAVVQFLTAGMDMWRDVIVDLLSKKMPIKGIFEKDDSQWREWEGLEKKVAKLYGEEPPDFVEILENGKTFVVDLHGGQKTGFYLDQRDNRQMVEGLAKDKRLLNCFSYTGAFSVYAALGGASEVISVDASGVALNTAKVQFEKNQIDVEKHSFLEEDVFNYLRKIRQEFDMIILDPPAFCKNKHQVLQASRGYKDINLHALKNLRAGGLLLTCSCSSYMTDELFQKAVLSAAKDARKNIRILQKNFQPFDHPVNIYHPEGQYLKALLCQAT